MSSNVLCHVLGSCSTTSNTSSLDGDIFSQSVGTSGDSFPSVTPVDTPINVTPVDNNGVTVYNVDYDGDIVIQINIELDNIVEDTLVSSLGLLLNTFIEVSEDGTNWDRFNGQSVNTVINSSQLNCSLVRKIKRGSLVRFGIHLLNPLLRLTQIGIKTSRASRVIIRNL